jgi:DNA-binding SARP family transcriptional activator
MTYRLRLLGPFELLAPSGRAVAIGGKKLQALVAMLALAGGAPVPRNRLTAVLWGDRGEAQARNSLRQALTALRRCFAGHGPFPFAITDETAAIDPAAIEADAATFASEGAAGLPGGGEFLEGLDIPGQPASDWLRAERQRLAGLMADRLSARMAGAEAAGDPQGAMAAARALLEADPLNEAAHRALMRALAAGGDRSRALKQFQTCRDLLKTELGVEPEAETLRLQAEIRGGNAGPAPAAPVTVEPMPGDKDPAPGMAPTVAVLPFVNLSADPEQEYFSDGITDDIITELGRFRNLRVIART